MNLNQMIYFDKTSSSILMKGESKAIHKERKKERTKE
jgi:hypothetical protein